MKTKKINKKDLKTLQEKIENLFLELEYRHIDKHLKTMSVASSFARHFPIKDGKREKLYRFFKLEIDPKRDFFSPIPLGEDIVDSSPWGQIQAIINSLFKRVVIQHCEHFLYDKYYGKLAMTIYRLKYLSEIPLKRLSGYRFILDESGTPINIVFVGDLSFNMYDKSFNNISFLLDEEVLESWRGGITSLKEQFFFKDLLSTLSRHILSNKTSTINDIDLEAFFEITNQEKMRKTEATLLEMKRIVLTRGYLRQRKERKITTLNRETFPTFFSELLMENIYEYNYEANFFAKVKKGKIKNSIFFPNLFFGKDSLKAVMNSYSFYIRCKLWHIDNRLKENEEKHKKYMTHFSSLDDLRRATSKYIPLLKKKYKDIPSLKMINAKKYATKTKKMIKDLFIDMISISIQGEYLVSKEEEDETLLFPEIIFGIDTLKEIGVNEKMIRAFYLPLFRLSNHTVQKEDEVFYHGELSHNIVEVLHSNVLSFAYTCKENEFTDGRFLNSLIQRLSTYSINLQSVEKLSKEFEQLVHYIPSLKSLSDKGELKPIKKLSDLDTLYDTLSFEKNRLLYEKIKKELDIDINNEVFTVAKNMRSKDTMLSLLYKIMDSTHYIEKFKQQNRAIGVSIQRNLYHIDILPHNDLIGLAGGLVGGVCIAGDGEERLSQVTPNFMNLVVRTQEKVLLWGLFCRAETKQGEVYYILNNLQGSINNKKIIAKEVLDDLYEVFREFYRVNHLSNVFYVQHGFNALALNGIKQKDIKIKDKEIYINENIRLDFYIDDGKVLDESLVSINKLV